jgi:chitin synthase
MSIPTTKPEIAFAVAENALLINGVDELHSSADALLGPSNAFCVTLYNEEVELLAGTLASIVVSLSQFHGGARHQNSFSTICIIADGAASLAPGMLEAFETWGFLDKRSFVYDDGIATHATLHSSVTLLPRICGKGAAVSSCHATCLRIVLCVKSVNLGKLHSHKHFFATLCARFSPRYCYQVDSGSILHIDTVSLLVDRLERDPGIGAIAPRVLPPTPKTEDSFLAHWQFFDFAFRAGTSWPFEVATGHLSVLPGQVSVVRWQALQGSAFRQDDEPRGNSEMLQSESSDGESAGEGATGTPLESYLHGMDEESPTDRLRYLAEDRVIGISLMFANRLKWRLDYLPEAKGTTDRCETFAELLKQRRRWHNSSMATRMWLLRQLPAYIRRPDRSWREKLEFLLAVGSQSILACREFFAPGFLVALLITLVTARDQLPAIAGTLINAYLVVSCLDLLLMPLPSLESSRNPLRLSIRACQKLLHVVSPVLYTCVIFAFPWPAAIILLLPALALLTARLVGLEKGCYIVARYQFSPIPSFAMFSVLSIYAFARLNDVSWGTKGLTKVALSSPSRARLARFRNKALGLWLPCNAALIFFAIEAPRFNAWSLNGVTLVSCLIDGVLAMTALGFLLLRKHQSNDSGKSTDNN